MSAKDLLRRHIWLDGPLPWPASPIGDPSRSLRLVVLQEGQALWMTHDVRGMALSLTHGAFRWAPLDNTYVCALWMTHDVWGMALSMTHNAHRRSLRMTRAHTRSG